MKYEQALNEWLRRAQSIAAYDLTIQEGRKYTKIVSKGSGVYCFIEKATGNILKAASWATPAKHARGNIYKIGEEGVDMYGAHYIIR